MHGKAVDVEGKKKQCNFYYHKIINIKRKQTMTLSGTIVGKHQIFVQGLWHPSMFRNICSEKGKIAMFKDTVPGCVFFA